MRRWYVLIVLSLAIFVITLDTTMMNVAITALSRDLHTDIQHIQMAIAIYSLVMAAGMITGAKMARIYGTKRIFITGVILYTTGTITAALSSNMLMLTLGWSVIEGIGASLMMPTILSCLMTTYGGKERVRAFAVYAAILVGGAAIGPIVGGLFTTYASWRWAFGMEAFIMAAVLIFSRILAPHEPSGKRPGLDIGGIALCTTGLVSLVVGIISANTYGWWQATKPLVIGSHKIAPLGISIAPLMMIAGGVLLASFVFWLRKQEKKGNDPLVPTSLFRNRYFICGTSTNFIMQMTIGAILFAVPFFLQTILHLNAFQTGLTVIPLTLSMLAMSFVTARLINRIPIKYLIIAGIVLMIVGAFIMADSFHPDMSMTSLTPGLVLIGTGLGLALSQIGNITLSFARSSETDEASGLYATFLNLGRSIGTAAVGAVMLSSFLSGIVGGIDDSASLPRKDKDDLTIWITESSRRMKFDEFETKLKGKIENYPDRYVEELETIGINAADNSMRITFYTLAGVFAGSLVASLFLPASKMVSRDDDTGEVEPQAML
ncbi:MAG: MFS transporter [Dehalococcoidales bacterium]